jgi:hypothetical protein
VNPDVAGAIARLEAAGVLARPPAQHLARVARRELVSVRLEIRALLAVGVVLLTSGVGVLVARHHREIGPWGIAVGIGLASAACFGWVRRRAAPFAWGDVAPPHVAFEPILLLGVLLLASGLAWVESQFAWLGPRWPYHLLVVAVIALLAAYRWDSRAVLGLALTSLAAWRGLTLGPIPGVMAPGSPDELRANALAVGTVYVAAAALSARLGRKAHFEPVLAVAGLLLVLGALVSGALLASGPWGAWLAALVAVAALTMAVSVRRARTLDFALAVGALYVGLVRLVFEAFPPPGRASSMPFLLAALLGVGVLALVVAAHRRMRER